MQWRGDDNDNSDAMSDILREVIVIPDDEESTELSSRSEDSPANTKREASVELIAARAAPNALHVQQVNYGRYNKYHDAATDSDEPDTGAYRAQQTTDQSRFDRLEAHRHKVWAAARSRHRRGPQSPIHDHHPSPHSSSKLERTPQPKSCSQWNITQEADRNLFVFKGIEPAYASAPTTTYPSSRENLENQIVDLTKPRSDLRRGPSTQVSLVLTCLTTIAEYILRGSEDTRNL